MRALLKSAAEVRHVGVVGAGAWGTALAITMARAGRRVTLWAREPEVVAEINAQHLNTPFLPKVVLPDDVHATGDLSEVAQADVLLLVVPSQFLRPTVKSLALRLDAGTPLLVCAKGVEEGTLALMGDVVSAEVSGNPVGVLSGPTFAREVADGLPTALTLALSDAGAVAEAPEESLAAILAVALSTPSFRPYITDDVAGAEVGGAVKNVLAIASGIAHGKGLGSNARAALITRGLAEIGRLAEALGGRHETVMGLSGMGDLTLTCSSEQSRNMSYGTALGRGKTHEQIMAGRRVVVEGVANARTVTALAQKLGVDMPICEAVKGILYDGVPVDDAIAGLLDRPIRTESRRIPDVPLPSPGVTSGPAVAGT